MLTDNEKIGIRDLLSRLDEDVVYSLADTATKKALALTSLTEAVDAIILHCESASWLLNRKKLTRNALFQYLNARGVPISGQADKYSIVERILNLWNDVAHASQAVYTHKSICNNESKVVETEQMGLTFAQWFYGILLSVSKRELCPSIADQFWVDSRLNVTFSHSGKIDSKECLGSEAAENVFKELILQYGLILNPNLTRDGVLEKQNAYGFVVIAVCGTFYQQGVCGGIFEQAFGLLRDPAAEFRWKVKWSDLRITRIAVSQVPCVRDLPELQAVCDTS